MNRRPYPKVDQRNAPILERIRQIKLDHPFWGYRRVWAHLRYVDGLEVNLKRILRLMRQHDLLAISRRTLRAKRTYAKSKPVASAPNQWWGIDMTKVCVNSFGWIYIVLVLDWYTKKVVGYQIGLRCTTQDWLAALDMALNRQFPDGAREHNLHLMSDNGSQPTSLAFMKACHRTGVHQAFTSYNNPRGNADTERMMRTLKEECLWLREWHSPFELAGALDHWIKYYNRDYLHSTLGYQSPEAFEAQHVSRNTQLVPA
jgi:putative transposase